MNNIQNIDKIMIVIVKYLTMQLKPSYFSSLYIEGYALLDVVSDDWCFQRCALNHDECVMQPWHITFGRLWLADSMFEGERLVDITQESLLSVLESQIYI